MPRVSTFCPKCGETIETEVPEEARIAGRAALDCPACKFGFEIAPPRRQTAPPVGDGGWTRVADEATSGTEAPPESTATQRDDAASPAAQPAPSPAAPGAATQTGRSFKPVAAAMMLFFASVLGLWMGSVLAFGDDVFTDGLNEFDDVGNFTGLVTGPDGSPLAGVAVTMVQEHGANNSTDGRATTTGTDGRYWFADTKPGVYVLTFEKANHTTHEVRAPAYPQEYASLFGADSPLGSVQMERGDPSEVERMDWIERFDAWASGFGWFILLASVLAIAGAGACLMRTRLWLAVLGAIAGIATIGYLVGAAVSLLALVLIVLSRREFRKPAKAAR